MRDDKQRVDILDAVFRRVALVNERFGADELERLCSEDVSGVHRSLGQRLMRARKLNAQEFLRVSRWLEEPILSCHDCDAGLAPVAVSESVSGRCPDCDAPLDPSTLVGAIDASRLTLTPDSTDGMPEPPLPAKTILGKYRLLSVLGIGGMGVVYKAEQMGLNRLVAVKVLSDQAGLSAKRVLRFMREARAVGMLRHPHIVSIHEAGVEDGIHYFSMDYIEGATLQSHFETGEDWSTQEAAVLVAKLARAVDYAHHKGVIHRDLKPSNILIGKDDRQPRISDFGLAKISGGDQDITHDGDPVGTPLYMSPEQVRGGSADERSDVYGLGTILYRLLTGVVPFAGRSLGELYDKILTRPPASPRSLSQQVSKDLEAVCTKALAKDADLRYQSALELAQDLERVLAGQPVTARSSSRLRLGYLAKWVGMLALVAAAAWGLSVVLRPASEGPMGFSSPVETVRNDPVRTEPAAQGDAAVPPTEAVSGIAGAMLAFEQGDVQSAHDVLAQELMQASGPSRRVAVLVALATVFERQLAFEPAAQALKEALASAADSSSLRQRVQLLEARLAASRGDVEPARTLLTTVGAQAPELAVRESATRLGLWLDVLGRPKLLPGAASAAEGDLDADGKPELILVRKDVHIGAFRKGRWVDNAYPLAPATSAVTFARVLTASKAPPCLAVCAFVEGRGPTLQLYRLIADSGGLQLACVAMYDLGSWPHELLATPRGGAVLVANRVRGVHWSEENQRWVLSDHSVAPALDQPMAALASAYYGAKLHWVVAAGAGDRQRLLVYPAEQLGVQAPRWQGTRSGVRMLRTLQTEAGGGAECIVASVELKQGASGQPSALRARFEQLVQTGERSFSLQPLVSYSVQGCMHLRDVATGDFRATGRTSLAVLHGSRETRRACGVVICQLVAGKVVAPAHYLDLRSSTAQWLFMVDLDADGDDELVCGGADRVTLFGHQEEGP